MAVFFVFLTGCFLTIPEHRDISLHYVSQTYAVAAAPQRSSHPKQTSNSTSQSLSPSFHSIQHGHHEKNTSTDISRAGHHASSLSHVSCKHRAREQPGCPSQALLSHLSIKEPPPDGPSTLFYSLWEHEGGYRQQQK